MYNIYATHINAFNVEYVCCDLDSLYTIMTMLDTNAKIKNFSVIARGIEDYPEDFLKYKKIRLYKDLYEPN